MRVLILSQYFWPESFPINGFVQHLESAGAHVTVLTGQPNYPDGEVFEGYRAASVRREVYGANTEIFRVPVIPRGNSSAFRLVGNYLSFVVAASTIGPWLLRGRKIDVVFVYAPSPILQAIPGWILKRYKGARLVTWVQDLWPQSLESTGFITNKRLLALAGRGVAWLYRRHDLLLGQSEAFVAAIHGLANGTPVEYFPNPGESASFHADGNKETPLTLPPGFNVVFAGNLGTVQALETILDAAAILSSEPDVLFVLVGSGSRSEWLASEVERRRLRNVMLPGRFERGAMNGILSQADALLVSLNKSRTLSQTIPSKLQTYLASGRPILASLDGEGADVVARAQAGFVSPAEDAGALAENVMRLLNLPPVERMQMGAAGRKFYDRHFQPDVLAEQLLNRFRELASATPQQG